MTNKHTNANCVCCAVTQLGTLARAAKTLKEAMVTIEISKLSSSVLVELIWNGAGALILALRSQRILPADLTGVNWRELSESRIRTPWKLMGRPSVNPTIDFAQLG